MEFAKRELRHYVNNRHREAATEEGKDEPSEETAKYPKPMLPLEESQSLTCGTSSQARVCTHTGPDPAAGPRRTDVGILSLDASRALLRGRDQLQGQNPSESRADLGNILVGKTPEGWGGFSSWRGNNSSPTPQKCNPSLPARKQMFHRHPAGPNHANAWALSSEEQFGNLQSHQEVARGHPAASSSGNRSRTWLCHGSSLLRQRQPRHRSHALLGKPVL